MAQDTRSNLQDAGDCRPMPGPDRSEAVKEVLQHLEAGRSHVHVFGPPGFGKRSVVEGLAARAKGRAIVIRLSEAALSGNPLGLTQAAIEAAFDSPMSDGPKAEDWASGWAQILALLKSAPSGRPILVFEGAEHLFPEDGSGIWPAGLFTLADVVTVSFAPIHLLMPELDRATGALVELKARPAAAADDGFGDEDLDENRWNAQEETPYKKEGQAWLERYRRSRDIPEDKKPIVESVFERLHNKRQDDVWDGHPLLNTMMLEAVLDKVIAGSKAREALERWRSGLANLHETTLAERLLPFTPGRSDSPSPAVVESVARAVANMADRREELNRTEMQWLIASGLAAPEGPTADHPATLRWSWPATLIARDPESPEGRKALIEWARKTEMSARQSRRILAEKSRKEDRAYREALDQVATFFCDSVAGATRNTRVEHAESKVIVPSLMYSFRLSYDADTPPTPDEPDPRSRGQDRHEYEVIRPKFDVYVFDTEAEGERYWRHHVRILSMLGRLHHPALMSFAEGGTLGGEGGSRKRAYIKIERVVEPLQFTNIDELVKRLPISTAQAKDAEDLDFAYRSIAELGEAVDLIHAQGILHRSLDFNALARDPESEEPRLVLRGFEYSSNIRSEFRKRDLRLTGFRRAIWNLACRAPECGFGLTDEIDPAIDVYAFGALAIMLVTGLPVSSVMSEVDRMLPIRTEEPTAGELIEDGEALKKATIRLRDHLLHDDRWPGDDPLLARLKRILEPCLDLCRDKRPTMEDLAPRLRDLYADYRASLSRGDEVFYLAYPTEKMGDNLKRLGLFEEDENLRSEEGKALLQTKLQEWVSAARWMHYREAGFPRSGEDDSAQVRREAKYVLAGPSVVFFASLYRPAPGEREDPTVLWLAFAMWRNEISLPDPDDPEFRSLRATTEDITWVSRPARVRVVPGSEVNEIDHQNSWEPTIEKLKRRHDETNKLKGLGREAATVWRLHHDIQLALESLRSFPVHVEAIDKTEGTYRIKLNVTAFDQANEKGPFSFLRQVIVRQKDPRAIFADSINAMAEEAGAAGLNFRLVPRGKKGGAKGARVGGSIILPVQDDEVTIRIFDQKDGEVPKEARIIWSNSIGTEVSSRRQSLAIERLQRRWWLMDYLVKPRHCGKIERQPSDSCGATLDAPRENREEFRDRVRAMLSSDPLHAVQGPPGTGKTTLIAALVAEVMAGEDGARLLVTSQSHAATDNVMLAVMQALERLARREDRSDKPLPTAIRVFSEATRKSVDPLVQKRFSIDAHVRAARERMAAKAGSGTDAPKSDLDRARAHLRNAARKGYLETRLKFERSSPLVFSTTGTAMTSMSYLRRGTVGFDFVLIDEAARAWSIDLIQPLSLANRAIMVGDQAQLPPFGEVALDELLENAKSHQGESKVPPDIDGLLVAASVEDGEEAPFVRMKGWLKLFHRLFEKCPPPADWRSKTQSIPLTQSLDRQFRSVDAIGDLVSDTFYSNINLKSAGPDPQRDRRLRLPGGAEGQPFFPSVVWIDTSGLTHSAAFSRRGNRGSLFNTAEAELFAQLLRQLETVQWQEDPAERLRILSPYKAQVEALERQFRGRAARLGVAEEDLPRLFQTVDSAQGSEADVVMISFCRRFQPRGDRVGGTGTSKGGRRDEVAAGVRRILGFLQQPERINVMMSRARQQIILAGDYEYYREGANLLDEYLRPEDGGAGERCFWTRLLDRFEEFDENKHLSREGMERPVILSAKWMSGMQQ